MFVSCHYVIVSYLQQGGLMGKVTASVPCSRSYLFTDLLIVINNLDNHLNTYNPLLIYFFFVQGLVGVNLYKMFLNLLPFSSQL